ncbi:TetR/AcrR family transcriptional regulator [Actinomadura violacea]|uniref:TetR/AcrR family transcriptional regulator C-terminal domain-containing protein n=1 Tax=Actinomadura violacea TaxID=2819934 RepID=A0ABS3S3V3_9ACTN|nr:TetR/AcrR family transcriptional regulator [Actinomadura violacea]MBO2463681.1 TetR/AcrR family transcriptional regulator C-terminal domain-containing protein [Actinomadura violacea]
MTESVWLRETRPRREAPPLSRGRIVAEAVALLDEEGADRLTMRRLAERLDTGSTTLYWHVKTKDDVLDLALDTIFGEVAVPSGRTDGWRADAASLVHGWRAAMLRHPWSVAVLGRPLLGPNVLARTEFLHSALAGAGLTGPDLVAAAYGLANFVIGSALMQVASGGADEGREAADGLLARERDRYPSLAAHGHLSGHDWDDAFARGLDYLLDGIAHRL